jgi:hypothetical protein
MGDCRAISGKGLSSIGLIIARMDRTQQTARKTPAGKVHKCTSSRNSAKKSGAAYQNNNRPVNPHP